MKKPYTSWRPIGLLCRFFFAIFFLYFAACSKETTGSEELAPVSPNTTTPDHIDITSFTSALGRVFSVAFSSEGNHVVSGTADGKAVLWDRATERALKSFSHDTPVLSVALTSDGSYVFAGTKAGKINLWNSHTGNRIRSVSVGNTWPIRIQVSPNDSLLLVYCSSTELKIFDAITLTQQQDFRISVPISSAVSFSCEGDKLLVSKGYKGADMELVSLTDTMVVLHKFFGHAGSVIAVDMCGGKRSLMVSGAADATIRLWDLRTGAQLKELLKGCDEEDATQTQHSSGDIQVIKVRLLTGEQKVMGVYFEHNELIIKIWNIENLSNPIVHKVWKVPMDQHLRYLTTLDISPDGGAIISSSLDQTVRLWRLNTDKSGSEKLLYTSYKLLN